MKKNDRIKCSTDSDPKHLVYAKNVNAFFSRTNEMSAKANK